MGLDVDYVLLLRSPAADPSLRDAGDASFLVSELVPHGRGGDLFVATAYWKNSSYHDVEDALSAFAEGVLVDAGARLLSVITIDGGELVRTWRRAGEGDGATAKAIVSQGGAVDWEALAPCFVPDEPATSFFVWSRAGTPQALPDLPGAEAKEMLASWRDAESLALAWDQPLPDPAALAAALHDWWCEQEPYDPLVIAYQTRIEGTFAWISGPSDEGLELRHVRAPFTLGPAPGALLR